ncbi:unnamed protein product [Penicillium glandicola]
MDESPDPTREDNSSTAAVQSLDSSVSEEPMKPTEAMATGDGATVNLGPAIPDHEDAEATKQASFTSSPESRSKRRSAVKHARVHFIDPVISEPDVNKSVASKTQHNVEESNPNILQVPAEAELGDVPEATLDEDDGAASEKVPRIGFKHDPDEERVLANVEIDFGTKKKKKNKKRPKSQRGDNAPSGFEPFYADAPITPKEFEENKTIYDPRIDEGIKRFLFKRRLDPYRRKVFLKYLQYGGVSVGPKHSQGVTPSELKEMTKEEAMQARSTTAIFPKMGNPYPISFTDVATGYLTGYFMGYYNPDTEEEIKICTDTMKNFFSYLLYHNVCPEQAEDLEEARKVCDRSAKELWMNQQLVHHSGPGDFNRGCSVLFGGYYFEDVDDPEAWTNVRHADQKIFTTDMARKAVKYGIAIAGNDRTAQKFKILVELDMTEAKQVPDIDGFEVISLEEPSEEIIAYYRELGPDLTPLGKIRAKEFRDPARGPFDLTPWEKVDWDAGFAPTYEFEFLVEPHLFVHILPGMKIITDVYETNFGQYYFDEILSALPSFYKFMYNDWMLDYVEPAPINFIPDEEEVARRRAKESIMRPSEPTPAEWAMHMLTHELDFNVPPGHDAMVAVWQMIHTLESFGWDLEEVKDLMGLVNPKQKGMGKSIQGEQRPTRLSTEPRNIPFDETLKQTLDRTIGYFNNPQKIQPVIEPEAIVKILKEKKAKIEKEQAQRASQIAKEQKIAKDKEPEGQPRLGPSDGQATRISDEQGTKKNKGPKGQPGPTGDQGTQTSDEQKIAQNKEPEGQPSQGLTRDRATQTSDEQEIAKSQEPEGQAT